MPRNNSQVPISDPKLPTVSSVHGDLEVQVMHSRCIGAAVCVKAALHSFVLNDQRKSVPTYLSANTQKTLENVARLCPTQAIILAKKGRPLWPKEGAVSKSKQPGAKHPMKLELLD